MQCQGWQVKCGADHWYEGSWCSVPRGSVAWLLDQLLSAVFAGDSNPRHKQRMCVCPSQEEKKSQPSLKTKGSPFQLHECWQQTTSVFCQLKNKWNVWQRRIWVGKITWYILYMKIEDIFLLNAAVITGNSSIQTGSIPITRIWSRAISRTWRRKSHFVFKFIYLWYLPHLDWQ